MLEFQSFARAVNDAKVPRCKHRDDEVTDSNDFSVTSHLRRRYPLAPNWARYGASHRSVAAGSDAMPGLTASEDESYMQEALALARAAAASGEVPVGAVVVMEGRIVGRAGNAPIAHCDPTAHAEILALRRAAQSVGNYRLPGAQLYVTVEPCVMCVGAMVQARVRRVIFGCGEPKSGALGSVYSIATDAALNHRIEVRAGICAEASSLLLQQFFRARRRGEVREPG